MQIRLKVVILAVAVAGVASGLSMWWFLNYQKQATLEQALLSAEREVSGVRQLVEMQNSLLIDRLLMLMNREQSARQLGLSAGNEATLNRMFLESDFVAMMLLKWDGKEQWSQQWTRERTSVTSRWPDGFLKSVVAELPVAGTQARPVTWYTTSDPARQPLFAVLTQLTTGNETHIAVGLVGVSGLQRVAEGFKGTPVEIAVVDERGFALAYSEQRYIGSNLQTHPAVAEILKRRELMGTRLSENRQRQSVATGFAVVGKSNLYVAAMIPIAGLGGVLGRLAVAILASALAAAIVGIGFGLLNLLPLEKAVQYLSIQLANVARGQPVSYPQEPNDWLTPLLPEVEKLISKDDKEVPDYIKEATETQVDLGKMGAYKEISLGLSQALRDPLASILGQAQLARAKAPSDEMKQHFVVIEREARRARDTMEHLLKMTGEEKFPRSRVDVQEVVLAALTSLKGALSSQGIKVQKELTQNTPVQAHAGQLQTALEEIIKNAVEAMADGAEKVLRVSSELKDGHFALIIEDTGKGIPEAQIAKVFEPFFTSKTGDDHKGLGLTVAKGIIKGFGGQLKLEGLGPRGVRATIEIPLQGSARAPKVEPVLPNPTETPVAGSKASLRVEQALSGTRTDHLPTAPAMDELTLTGIRPGDEKILAAVDLPLPGISANEDKSNSAETVTDVSIRRPKLRGPA